MNYQLFFDDHQIGTITKKDEDFLNLFGTYDLLASTEKAHPFIFQYIQYSIQASMLMGEDEKKWEEFMEKEESKYMDLIETENWHLIDENGKTHKILVPIFHYNNEIIWRWNT